MGSYNYAYQNLGKTYHYQLDHYFGVIDLLNDEAIEEYNVSMQFSLKLLGRSSTGRTTFDLLSTGYSVPESIHDRITASILSQMQAYSQITEHLILEVNAEGKVEGIENIKEIREKWSEFKKQLIIDTATDTAMEMLENGELEFGSDLNFLKTLQYSPVYQLLFPSFYNRVINAGSQIGCREIRSSFLPAAFLPADTYFDIDTESDVTITESYFTYEKASDAFPESELPDNVINLFFKDLAHYTIDSEGHINTAELFRSETINGDSETLQLIDLRSI